MKRSETSIGQQVVVGAYGRKAEIADNGAWEQGDWRGFRVSDAELVEHGSDLKAIGPKFACIAFVNGMYRAAFRRTKGSSILVKYPMRGDGFRLDITTLGAVRPAEQYDAEQQRARDERSGREELRAARRKRADALPNELCATVGQYGQVAVSLDALERIVAAARQLDDLVGLGLVDTETLEEIAR